MNYYLCNTRYKNISSDLNGKGSPSNSPKAANASGYPPTSGFLMAEKMKLGREDQGDTDTGDVQIKKNNPKTSFKAFCDYLIGELISFIFFSREESTKKASPLLYMFTRVTGVVGN